MKKDRCEISKRVSLCSADAIEIDGLVLTPDRNRAYMECFLSHAFPVVTIDGTGIHPQVVANSYRSMQHQVFDLLHLIRAYSDEVPRDRVLGTVVAVEFPATPEGGWKVQPDRSKAPGIRAVAVVHRQLEQAEQFVEQQKIGRIQWTVSMENNYDPEFSGLAVAGSKGVEKWLESTPEDMRNMGYTYIPLPSAPADLLEVFDSSETKIIGKYRGQEVIFLLGGLSGSIRYKGIGVTPLGKENEARFGQVLASGISYVELDGEIVPKVMAPLAGTLRLLGGR